MATQNLGKCVSIPVAADYSSSQYRFVTINSSGRAALTGDGAKADGVLQDDPAAAGRAGAVMVGVGVSKVTAGGVCTAGGEVASDATGRAVNAVTGDVVVGTFMTAAANAGEIVEVLFQPGRATT